MLEMTRKAHLRFYSLMKEGKESELRTLEEDMFTQ